MQSGRRVAIDVGSVRIGVAASDFHAILASGLATVQRTEDFDETLSNLVAQVAEAEPVVVYVGLPISLAGRETASTSDAIALAKSLRERLSIPVRMVDERLSTVSAAGALRASKRSSKDGRKIIDQIAATIILEQAMATEKTNQQWAGESIDDF